MSESRLNIRISSFHKKMMEKQLGVNSAEKKEGSVISKEMKEVHLEQKVNETPIRKQGFRNIECLLENPKEDRRNDENYNRKDRRNERVYDFNNIEEEKEKEEEDKKFVMKEEDFPDIIKTNKEEKTEEKTENKIKWSLKLDTDDFKKVADEINTMTKSRLNEETYNKSLIDRERKVQELREQRLDEYIKKVKKSYEKDYLVYDMEDYLEFELRDYIDEDDIDDNEVLYEEMLEETINRDYQLDIELLDGEHYYKVYDEESKYYESEMDLNM